VWVVVADGDGGDLGVEIEVELGGRMLAIVLIDTRRVRRYEASFGIILCAEGCGGVLRPPYIKQTA
jgi:hypothetical protein